MVYTSGGKMMLKFKDLFKSQSRSFRKRYTETNYLGQLRKRRNNLFFFSAHGRIFFEYVNILEQKQELICKREYLQLFFFFFFLVAGWGVCGGSVKGRTFIVHSCTEKIKNLTKIMKSRTRHEIVIFYHEKRNAFQRHSQSQNKIDEDRYN